MSLAAYLGLGAGAIIMLTSGALLLPRLVTVQRSAVISADPAKILALAASNQGYQTFNPYKSTDPALKIGLFGPGSGVGSGFTFDGKDGKGSQVVTAVTSSDVRYAIDLGAMGKPTSSISVAPEAGKVRVTWRTDMDMGANPVGRVFGLFMDGMLGGTYETGLKNLAVAAVAAS
jgi:Polyketide cyclase / dehydrase and lipid transport